MDSCAWIDWLANGPRAEDVGKHLSSPVLAHAPIRNAQLLTLDTELGRVAEAIYYSKSTRPEPRR